MTTIKSIKEKAKAYDIALNKIKRLLGTGSNCSREELEYVFPELKEFEDERIRKAIKLMYSFLPNEPTYIGDVPVKDIFAWLEKQGEKVKPIEGFDTEFERQVSYLIASAMNKDYEYTKDFVKWTSEGLLNYAKHELEKQCGQKTADRVEPKFKVGDKIKLSREPKYPAREIIAIKNDAYYFDELVYLPLRRQDEWELVVQKPAEWSKEDEENLNWFEKFFRAESVIAEGKDIPQDRYLWFKNLKGRVQSQSHWKPSEEQMKAMQKALVDLCGKDEHNIITGLYYDLKKLRGEWLWKS